MKSCFFLILVLAGIAAGAIEKRIFGSQSCGKDRQYHVEIETVQGKTTCGGALLNPRWVITAAHCAGQKVKVKFGLNAYTSTWKKIKNFFKNKKQEQEIDANQQFAYKEEEHNHDIVLIKLNEDVSAKLPTINLPAGECQKPELKQVVEIGGWGAKKSTKKAKKLMCATTTIADCDSDKPSGNYHSDETNTMCAFKAGVESCYGDSGTAVEHNGVLSGIIVSNPIDKCANPIEMLNICHYLKWIEETMRSKN